MRARERSELAASLERALRAPADRPSSEELARLRAALEVVPLLAASSTPGARRAPRLLVAAVLACLAALAVAAARPPLPTPLRALAVSIGLPVDDAAVAAVKGRIAALEAALVERDPRRARSAAAALRASLGRLSRGDEAKVQPEAGRILALAEQLLAASGAPETGGTPPPTSSPPPRSTVAPSASTPSVTLPPGSGHGELGDRPTGGTDDGARLSGASATRRPGGDSADGAAPATDRTGPIAGDD
ncbi:MAG TPA: hypothetical protein VKV23_08670 [Acidimicrobiales bacterium]|nr:hypothetical protein [Acidimicrobiales bacterium]